MVTNLYSAPGGRGSIDKMQRSCLDSFGSGILIGKIYFGVLQNIDLGDSFEVIKIIHLDN